MRINTVTDPKLSYATLAESTRLDRRHDVQFKLHGFGRVG